MTNFIASEKLGSGFTPTRVEAFTRSLPLRRVFNEAEKPRLSIEQLDTRDRHLAELRQIIYSQLKSIEKDELKIIDAERVQNLLATLNDLMADYQTLRQIHAADEYDP